jgi:hypothetical protein
LTTAWSARAGRDKPMVAIARIMVTECEKFIFSIVGSN